MITYLKGDATRPVGDGPKIIMHVCNDAGGWGAGFVTALSKRWDLPEAQYRAWHRFRWELLMPLFKLGQTQWAQVEDDVYVASMLAQHGFRSYYNATPLDYLALDQCLYEVSQNARNISASVHAPRIGCGLAGGTWDRVEPLINKHFEGLQVFIYDLE